MFSWKELYFGTDFKEYTRIRNILEDNQIPAKTQVTNTRSRMSRDLPLGGNPAVLDSAGQKSLNDEYKILVKNRIGKTQSISFPQKNKGKSQYTEFISSGVLALS